MMESQQHRLDQLTEHIVMYMQALNHPQLSDVCQHTHITECICVCLLPNGTSV